jgi:hypothetical protein
MATSPISITTGDNFPLEPGDWQFNNVLAAAGPTTFQISTDDGLTFRDMTDGVFTASSDGTINIGRGSIFRATIQTGDTLTMALVRGWGKGA